MDPLTTLLDRLLALLPLGALDAQGTEPCVFVRGDVSGTDPGETVSRDLFDAGLILAFLYNVAPLNTEERPDCADASDETNCLLDTKLTPGK